MAKTKISEYSTTNSSNTDINSINIDENCAPSGINNAIREVMVHLKNWQTNASGDGATFGSLVVQGTGSFTGAVTMSAGATLSGTNTLSGSNIISGNINSSGSTNTFSGTQVISGNINSSGSANTFSGSVALSGGTANGVLYLNGSKVATSGSALVFDGSNLGLGVTPSAWYSTGYSALQVKGASIFAAAGNDTNVASNAFVNTSPAWAYVATGTASRYEQTAGQHRWFTAPSGTAGNTITFTQAMTLDESGNLGIGTSSPQTVLNNLSSGSRGLAIETAYPTIALSDTDNSDYKSFITQSNADLILYNSAASGVVSFYTNDTERARITSDGDLYVNTTTATGFSYGHRIYKNVAEGTSFLSIDAGSEYSSLCLAVSGAGYSVAVAGQWVGKNSSNSRSINAGGTINASGADYAEYMVKASDFTIAKGDICGINADGKLTNVFSEAIAFVVKSTDPSYVGGDSWGTKESIGLDVPIQPSDNATDEEKAQYTIDKAQFDEALETARQRVDRISFSGQVPVNVMGATAGQFIVPIEDNGGIKGVSINEADMTLAQYIKAVGKVIAIEPDGRAKIIVKVA